MWETPIIENTLRTAEFLTNPSSDAMKVTTYVSLKYPYITYDHGGFSWGASISAALIMGYHSGVYKPHPTEICFLISGAQRGIREISEIRGWGLEVTGMYIGRGCVVAC